MPLDPALAALDLGLEYWQGLSPPPAKIGPFAPGDVKASIQVDTKGLAPWFSYELNLWHELDPNGVFHRWSSTDHTIQAYVHPSTGSTIRVFELKDDTITEFGYSFSAYDPVIDSVFWDRRGTLRAYRVNAGAAISSGMQDAYTQIDLASGDLDGELALVGNNIEVKTIMDLSTLGGITYKVRIHRREFPLTAP